MPLRFTIRDLLWLTLAGCLLASPPNCSAEENGATKPLVSFSGAHSQIGERSYQLITSAKDWTNLWLRHTGTAAAGKYDDFYNPAGVPEVNFDKCMVIAIFSGKSKNIAGIEAASYTEDTDQIKLRIRAKGYQTGGRPGADNGDAVTPYGLFVVNRTPGTIVIEQDVQDLKGQPPIWKEAARFPKR
jgi:hypothetical protein